MTSLPAASAVAIPLGGLRLAGRLHRPRSPAVGAAVVAHGLNSSMQSAKLGRLAQALAGRGWLALQYDAQGCGDSPGEVRQTSLSGRRDELLAAAAFLAELAPGLPLAYLGSSLGGSAAILAADLAPPAALVCWSTPIDWLELLARMSRRPDPPDLPALAADIPGHDFDACLARLSRVLFVHGQADEVAPVDQARRGHALAQAPKQLMILPGADHRLSRLADQDRAIAATLAWLGRCLEESEKA
ncbi:MAG: alpha/beta hydrolase [Thermodesulfobacteriota bacterium]